RDAGGREGIGGDDVCAGTKIGEMNVADFFRLSENEQIVVAAHFTVPGIEARAPKTLLVETERLDHGAHGAVEHEDALGRYLAQRGLRRLARRHRADSGALPLPLGERVGVRGARPRLSDGA